MTNFHERAATWRRQVRSAYKSHDPMEVESSLIRETLCITLVSSGHGGRLTTDRHLAMMARSLFTAEGNRKYEFRSDLFKDACSYMTGIDHNRTMPIEQTKRYANVMAQTSARHAPSGSLPALTLSMYWHMTYTVSDHTHTLLGFTQEQLDSAIYNRFFDPDEETDTALEWIKTRGHSNVALGYAAQYNIPASGHIIQIQGNQP